MSSSAFSSDPAPAAAAASLTNTAPSDVATSEVPPSRTRDYRITFAIVAAAVGAFTLMQSMTVPVITEIQMHFETSRSTATWVLTAYLLSATVATPLIGRAGDVWGKRRMLVISLLMLSLGSLVAALAPSIEVMIAARVLQGFGGGMFPLAFGIIRDEFPAHRVDGGVSVVSSLGAVGFGAGIVVSGPIFDQLGYAWLFWLPMIVTAIVAVMAAIFVPPSKSKTGIRPSLLPGILLALWLVCLLLAVSQAPDWGWLAPRTLGLALAAIVVAVGWVLAEMRARVPVVDIRMMRQRPVWTTNLVALLIGVIMYSGFGFLPQFVQAPSALAGYGFDADVTRSGIMMLPVAITSFIAGIVVAPIVRRIGAKALVAAASATAALGMSLLASFHDTPAQFMIGMTLNSIGVGLVFSSLASLVVHAVPAEQTGIATGMNANIRTLGGALGSAVMGTLVTAEVSSAGVPAESGFVAGFWMLAGIGVVTALVAIALIPGVRSRRSAPIAEPVAAVAELSAAPCR